MMPWVVLLLVVPSAVKYVFQSKNRGAKYDAQMIELYRQTHSTTGMTDNEILKKAIALTGRQ